MLKDLLWIFDKADHSTLMNYNCKAWAKVILESLTLAAQTRLIGTSFYRQCCKRAHNT